MSRGPVRALTNCQIAPPSGTLERRRIEQNRLLSSQDLRPGWAASFRDELLVKNNDVWFRRAVDACSGEGLQTVNGSATV
jgi:hypothetical protein